MHENLYNISDISLSKDINISFFKRNYFVLLHLIKVKYLSNLVIILMIFLLYFN